MTTDGLMPAAFIGHGSPMNTLERNAYTDAWRAVGSSLPRPEAVLCISAHWYVNATAVTAMARPRTIHDFYGFPDELFAFDYPAPGSEALAKAVVNAVHPVWVGLDHDSWGLDHGTWSVLTHVFPAADIPVVQLSINATKPADYHIDLGRRLAPLREQGIFIVGSGNIVHNLRNVDWQLPDHGYDWAERFDHEARRLLTEAPESVLRLLGHEDFSRSVPTPDHFLPMLYLAGLAVDAREPLTPLVDGCVYGSISMTSYTLGLPIDERPVDGATAGELPAALPDDANI